MGEADIKERYGSQTGSQTIEKIVPFSMFFHEMGINVLRSVSYNFGANFIGAGLITWAMIGSKADWHWRNIAYNNNVIAYAGVPGIYIGYALTILNPFILYIAGRSARNERLQLTGLALAQNIFITFAMQSALKMMTGRATPDIMNFAIGHKRRDSADDFSAKWKPFCLNFVDGWPSGHTATAFSAAALIAEMYHNNIPLKIGVYTYAAIIGLGMSVSVHWASEVIAGALIGYAIGKAVGKSFRKKLEGNIKEERISLLASPAFIGLSLRY